MKIYKDKDTDELIDLVLDWWREHGDDTVPADDPDDPIPYNVYDKKPPMVKKAMEMRGLEDDLWTT